MIYHITKSHYATLRTNETKIETTVAAYYHRKHIAYEIHRRMTVVQSIIKDNDNKDNSRNPPLARTVR